MNQGQEQFFNFFMEKAKDEKKEEAKALLNECFEKQTTGEFSPEFLSDVIPKMLETIKPEYVQEVKGIMENFGSRHTS